MLFDIYSDRIYFNRHQKVFHDDNSRTLNTFIGMRLKCVLMLLIQVIGVFSRKKLRILDTSRCERILMFCLILLNSKIPRFARTL